MIPLPQWDIKGGPGYYLRGTIRSLTTLSILLPPLADSILELPRFNKPRTHKYET
jgi:hypothetical protein